MGASIHSNGPPAALPHNVSSFLAEAFGVDVPCITRAWTAQRELIWECRTQRSSLLDETALRNGRYLPFFLQYGVRHRTVFYPLYPPTRVCLDPKCALDVRGSQALSARELTRINTNEGTLFTTNFGALPCYVYSAACPGCHTRYYPSFYVHRHSSEHIYYHGTPHIVNISMHYYIEASLCERFSNAMVCSWTSATNLARIYNLDVPDASVRIQAPWSYQLQINTEQVWDAFFVHGLLLDCSSRNTILILDVSVPQDQRLHFALETRNRHMVGPGQKYWNHACNLCCAEHKSPDGTPAALQASAVDGISIGRPCCSVHDCKEALSSQRDRFCYTHADMRDICVIVDCDNHIEPGHQTCSKADHRQLEVVGIIERTAMFQLKKRLEHLNVTQPETAIMQDLSSSDDLPNTQEGCEGKSDEGNAKPHAQFGCHHTHNEQLCVTSCGIIQGWATFYGSESPNGVWLFLHALFPTAKSVPGVIFHDNNCHVKKLINNLQDSHFDRCALPVDVFHMKSKHKESDEFCGRWCNPAHFPDLMVNDKWCFNSSAAEMTNAWFGGFQGIVREMRVDWYEFFLDEMIQ
ncbi:hypothetical protein QCA50_020537 [Cerrena zonata]|uniref:C2H2-type domain-containing protein n=1 Tax=Cerrena zonata TaxID=2478898 RepID=A0AAW0FD23_9APHY